MSLKLYGINHIMMKMAAIVIGTVAAIIVQTVPPQDSH